MIYHLSPEREPGMTEHFDSFEVLLRAARSRRPPLPEILLWTTTSLHPSESQTSECSDLLSRSRATCLIVAQRQPGKLMDQTSPGYVWQRRLAMTGTNRWEKNIWLIKITPAAIRFDWLVEVLLAARSRTKIEKVTLDAVKLTAIFSKRRKIGAS